MQHIFFETKVIWSQIDSNNHLRHSAYADLACQGRVELLEQMGVTNDKMMELGIGPILFEEKTVYRREVKPNTTVSVSCVLLSCRKDVARWSFKQEIFREDGILAAIVTTVGAWIDLKTRRLAVPPEEIASMFLDKMPRDPDCDIYE